MKHRKSLSSLLLLSVLLGTTLPVVALAESTSSTVAVSSTSTSAVEPSSTSAVDPSSTSAVDPSSTSAVEPSSTSVVEPSSTSVVDPSSTSTVDPSSTSVVEPSTSSSTTSSSSSQTVPDLSIENGTLEAIIGKDDQYRVRNTTRFPYRTVVHLEMEYEDGTYLGSGVLIAPDLVLTVAHNLYDQDSGKWAKSVVATPGRDGSRAPYGKYAALNYYVPRKYTTERPNVPSDYDIAVVKLSRKVPSSVGYLSVSTSVRPNDRVQIPGYPAMTRSKVSYMHTSFGKVDEVSSTLIGHLVDTEGGNSGSAILNANNQVVGVHSAGRYTVRPYGTYNWGRRVDGLALQMIDIAKNNKSTNANVISHLLPTPASSVKNVYRLYNPGLKVHLYTTDPEEVNVLQTRGWNYEGISWRTETTKGAPVYRLYNPSLKVHLYTRDASEYRALATRGWQQEGIAYRSYGKIPVYRLYHPGIRRHLYTRDVNEYNALATRGWKQEGISFYTR